MGRELERRPPETQARRNEARAGLDAVLTLAEKGVISVRARWAIEFFAEWGDDPMRDIMPLPWPEALMNRDDVKIITNVVVLNRLPDWLKDPSTADLSDPKARAFIRAAEVFGRAMW